VVIHQRFDLLRDQGADGAIALDRQALGPADRGRIERDGEILLGALHARIIRAGGS